MDPFWYVVVDAGEPAIDDLVAQSDGGRHQPVPLRRDRAALADVISQLVENGGLEGCYGGIIRAGVHRVLRGHNRVLTEFRRAGFHFHVASPFRDPDGDKSMIGLGSST